VLCDQPDGRPSVTFIASVSQASAEIIADHGRLLSCDTPSGVNSDAVYCFGQIDAAGGETRLWRFDLDRGTETPLGPSLRLANVAVSELGEQLCMQEPGAATFTLVNTLTEQLTRVKTH
jgi:hypothetical protein